MKPDTLVTRGMLKRMHEEQEEEKGTKTKKKLKVVALKNKKEETKSKKKLKVEVLKSKETKSKKKLKVDVLKGKEENTENKLKSEVLKSKEEEETKEEVKGEAEEGVKRVCDYGYEIDTDESTCSDTSGSRLAKLNSSSRLGAFYVYFSALYLLVHYILVQYMSVHYIYIQYVYLDVFADVILQRLQGPDGEGCFGSDAYERKVQSNPTKRTTI